MPLAYEIAKLPKGAVIEVAHEDGTLEVLMPDGSRQFISVELGDAENAFRVVKTIFPADAPVTISVGNAKEVEV